MPRFSNPRGTRDILPGEWPRYRFVIDTASEVARLFGYRRIETPAFGRASLFTRTTGEGTDIVDKEMYVFKDRDGENMALRPEGTAPVMRAYHEHGMGRLSQPVKLYYVERMYRYDKPQQDRYREHRQFGCEAMGLEDAYVDVEMLSLLHTFLVKIGLGDADLHLNSIGDANCRPAYLAMLLEYLRANLSNLSPQDRERVERNPLRVLDSKDADSQRIIEGAPHMLDHLCHVCREHWVRVIHGLDLLNIPWRHDHSLVRGLDYYTRTAFEFVPPGAGQQGVLAGGGRYDVLSEAMGEKPVPGIGFGSGIERLVRNIEDRGMAVPEVGGPDVYVAYVGDETDDEALKATYELRRAGIAAEMAFGGRVLKTQLKNANAAGARFVAIIGEDEAREGAITLRSMDEQLERKIAAQDIVDEVSPKSGAETSSD